MTTYALQEQSLWASYKRAVWNQSNELSATIHNAMRVLRAIHNSGELAYTSVPITSGRYLYEQSLAGKLDIEEVMAHNYFVGWQFVEELIQRLPHPILYPADLTPINQQWEQAHFQALWLSIIAEKATELHMADGWEYSNGGCEEFTHVMQLRLGPPEAEGELIFYNTKEDETAERRRMQNIRVFNQKGERLELETGIGLIQGALSWLRHHGFTAPKIEHCLELLQTIGS